MQAAYLNGSSLPGRIGSSGTLSSPIRCIASVRDHCVIRAYRSVKQFTRTFFFCCTKTTHLYCELSAKRRTKCARYRPSLTPSDLPRSSSAWNCAPPPNNERAPFACTIRRLAYFRRTCHCQLPPRKSIISHQSPSQKYLPFDIEATTRRHRRVLSLNPLMHSNFSISQAKEIQLRGHLRKNEALEEMRSD